MSSEVSSDLRTVLGRSAGYAVGVITRGTVGASACHLDSEAKHGAYSGVQLGRRLRPGDSDADATRGEPRLLSPFGGLAGAATYEGFRFGGRAMRGTQ